MRPVVKLTPGTYTMPDGSSIDVRNFYKDYHDAKPALVYNLGLFCSYCEEAYHQARDLHVEHVQPKGYEENGVKIYARLEKEWSNFLLSCATCNGADNKDTKNVILSECHLPHLNNTYKSLVYKEGGVVEVNPVLTGDAYHHAKKLLDLVGLGKSPATSRPGDTRYKKRSKDWDLACKYRARYDAGKISSDVIVDLVKNRGGWSIWFTVFSGCDDVRNALLDFPGPARLYFDAANHYEPLDRNPGFADPT